MAQAVDYKSVPLSQWTKTNVCEAISDTPILRSDSCLRVINARNVDGAFLEAHSKDFPRRLLDEMFDHPLKKVKFIAQISDWRQAYSQVLNVQSSLGDAVQVGPSDGISRTTTLQRAKGVIQAKLGRELPPLRFLNTKNQELVERNTLAQNLLKWGDTLFLDLNPRQIPSGIRGVTLTTSSGDRDVITLQEECDPNFPRAKFPCGHAVSAYSMLDYLRDSLRRFQFEIFCPLGSCRHPWDWEVCKQVACVTREEARELDTLRDDNETRILHSSKACPNAECGAEIYRGASKHSKVRCRMCNGPWICWRCLELWRGSSSCGNVDCDTELLATCDVMKISGTDGVPIYRACPRCDVVVRYRTACRHIICPTCSLDFCMICVRQYPCQNCSLAPRSRN